jgi:hypothetical protein
MVKFSTRSFQTARPQGKRAREGDRVPPNRITRGSTGTFFKTPAEFWMNLQMTYDLRNAEKALPARVKKSIKENRSAERATKCHISI